MKNKEYIIPFSGLKQGTHSFDFVLGEKFFQQFDFEEFISTQIQVTVQLNKMSTMMEFAFAAQGSVRVPCDVTGELFDLPIQATLDLVVKFGEEFNDENESLLILPHMEHQVDIPKCRPETYKRSKIEDLFIARLSSARSSKMNRQPKRRALLP